jgi:hypothetical protein
MSWDAYVDSLKQRGMVGGAICGLDGSWFVASDGSKITLEELKSILNNYGKDTMYSTGVKLGGVKYMYLSSADFSPFPLRCKKGANGAHIVKSNTTMMVGIYDESKKAEEAAVAVESVVESLIKANY